MRIGIISTMGGYTWAGSEELWYATALRALDAGHTVEVMISAETVEASQIGIFKKSGGRVSVHPRSFHPRFTSIKQSILHSYQRFVNRHDIVLLSLGSLLDVFYRPGLLNALLASQTKLISLCQFNSDLLHISYSQRLSLRKFFQLTTAQVFVSKHNLELAKRQCIVSFSNPHVVYNPIRVNTTEPLPMPNGNELHFGCVARFEVFWKGHDVLLDVLREDRWERRSWHLNLYGSGPDVDYVNDLIKALGLESRVTHHGHVAEIQSVWKNNHLMVLASKGEGTPLAILEAMMCGRPTVTTDVGGNREILKEGLSGWISEGTNRLSFGKALEKAWESRDRWEAIGVQAHMDANRIASENPSDKLLEIIVKA